MNLDNLKLKPEIVEQLKSCGITDKLEMAHFLSQCHHESAGFNRFVENLNYSKEGLLKIFPKYFDEATAEKYQKRAQAIANRVYANRMGNADEQSGDGWKYRGRGAIQLTGKSNYAKFLSTVQGKTEDDVATSLSIISAAWFWKTNNIGRLCTSDSDQAVANVTRKVNGGTHGLADRIKWFKHYNKLL